MSTVKEQAGRPESRIEQGLAVSERVQLERICLMEGYCRRNIGIEKADVDIKQRRSIETDVDERESRLKILIRLTLTAFEDGSVSENDFMEIEARFLVLYKVDRMEGLTKDHFNAFAEYNAVFNVWPYWREYVQSSTVRMGLPPLTVPVYRIGGKKPLPLDSSGESKNVVLSAVEK